MPTQKSKYTAPEIIFPELQYGGIPKSIHLDENLLPYITEEISDHLNPYKVYTSNRRSYHKRYCSNIYNIRAEMHLYDAIDSQFTPCSKCRPRATKDEWYIEMFEKIKKSPTATNSRRYADNIFDVAANIRVSFDITPLTKEYYIINTLFLQYQNQKRSVIFMPISKVPGQKKDGKQKYRVRVNYIDHMGKYKQTERTAYGREEALELERQLKNDIKENPTVRLSVQQLFDEYIKVKQHEVRETTLEKSQRLLSAFVLPHFKNTRLDRITVPMLQHWKTSIEELKTSDGKSFSLKYKKTIFGEFRTFLNYAVKMEYIPKNLLLIVGTFKDSSIIENDMDYYTPQEFLTFINAARSIAIKSEKETNSIHEWNYYVFFNIAFYLGARKGEIYALKWSDINGTTVKINRSISQKLKGNDRETPPKNRSSIRTNQIPMPLQKILDEHYKRYQQVNGFNNDWRICGGEMCIRDSNLERRNKSYAAAAGVKKIRVHDFRHSHASLLANHGINIQEIARRLGHSNIEITWNTYSHLYPTEQERAISVLDKIIKE